METSPRQFTVQPDQDGQRADLFLAACVPGLTRSQAQKMIKDGRVTLDTTAPRPKDPVQAGQVLEIVDLKDDGSGPDAVSMKLDILFEDEDLIILNKPAGLVVHEAAGHAGDTLVNGLLHYLGDALRNVKGGDRPGIVHRLDKETSGCLAVAKTDAAYDSLVAQLADHSAGRTYLAWTWGLFEEDEATVEAPIGRHPGDRQKMAVVKSGGKHAVTHFKVLQRARAASLLELTLETGRTHQIRVHLSEIGHAVVGDPDYGGMQGPRGQAAPLRRQALHAWKLQLKHPATGKTLTAEAPPPPDFIDCGEKLKAMM